MPKRGQFKKGAKARSVRQRKFNSKPEQKKRRAKRNRDRAKAEREGRVKKGDGKDLDHKNRRTLKGKTTVTSKAKNRSKNSPLSKKRRRRK